MLYKSVVVGRERIVDGEVSMEEEFHMEDGAQTITAYAYGEDAIGATITANGVVGGNVRHM